MANQTDDQIREVFTDIDYTQGIRKEIVGGIKEEAIRNKDPELLRTTMQALDGMDRVSLGRLKINEKAKANETNANEAAALAAYLVSLGTKEARAARRNKDGKSNVGGTKLPEGRRPTYDKSQTDTAPTGENTTEFAARMSGKG